MKNRKLLALAAALLVMLLVATGAMADTKKVNAARNGVVYMEQLEFIDGMINSGSRGTAFFIGEANKNPEYLVTCAHCVEGYYEFERGTEYTLTTTDGSQHSYNWGLRVYFDSKDYVEAYLVDYDSALDIAILRIENPTDKREPLKLKVPTNEMVSESAYAIGFPSSADRKDTVEALGLNDVSVTTGVISRLLTNSNTGRREVQMDAAVYGGNSGGPLVNEKGAVIGVNANIFKTDPTFYAVNIIEIKEMLDRNNIKYTLEGEGFPIFIVVGMVVLIAVLVAAILLVVKKQPSGGKASGKGSVGGRVLVFERGALAGQTFELKRNQKVVIGRGSDCQIRFPGDTAGVSKVHCTVTFDGQTVTIRDENSTAGTYIDEQKMKPGVAVTLHRGHPVGLGSKAQIMTLRSKK